MQINHSNLAILNQAFSGAFRGALSTASPMWGQVASLVPSTTAENKYAWLGQITRFREWIGERQMQSLVLHDYAVKNKTYENTVEISREEIEDDQYGVYTPVVQQLGQDAALHPDELVFSLLNAGFGTRCYDGQYFFDTDHPVGAPGNQVSVSNFQGGTGTPWFLLDTTKIIKPFLYQKRRDYAFTSKTSLNDENVFTRNMFVWGSDGRGNSGMGLWQLAYASKETLDSQSYADARASHQSLRGDNGKPLAIQSKVLLVPPNLEQAALKVVQAENLANGATNVMRNLSTVVVCPWLNT